VNERLNKNKLGNMDAEGNFIKFWGQNVKDLIYMHPEPIWGRTNCPHGEGKET
jgi:hypothetical protein